MPIDKKTAEKHLGDVLFGFGYLKERVDRDYVSPDLIVAEPAVTKYLARFQAALKRLAPPGSEYAKALEDPYENQWQECCRLAGYVEALRDDYRGEYLETFQELINAEMFSDFLSMAEYLIQDENLKQPAAVLAGGVLEEHVRKLCGKHGIDVTYIDGKGDTKPKRADTMNADLRKANVYGGNDQKQVTAWCGIRNSAAHAKHDEYTDEQVNLMIQGIRGFVSRYPA